MEYATAIDLPEIELSKPRLDYTAENVLHEEKKPVNKP